jgi:hypothetical protein
LIDLIPQIYDTQRIARIIGVDGQADMVRIDPMQPEAVREIRDENNIVIDKIYNPTVGKYDVVVTTGPGYLSQRQEAMDAMAQILQGNPSLWAVAGDLFVKNMDWPGAQEMAERLKKSLDPKLLAETDEDPALQAANQQIQAMGAEMEQMFTMIQNVGKSMEAQELQIKEYEAETKRISALSGGMMPEQVQELVINTIRDVMNMGSMVGQMPQMQPEMMPPEMMPPEMMPPEMMPPDMGMAPPDMGMAPPEALPPGGPV